MKKIILTSLTSILLLNVNAQDNNVKLQLAPLVWGEIRLSYERVTNENQTAQINLGVMPAKSLPTFIYDESEVETYGGDLDLQNKIYGFSISGEYRFYTSSSKDAPRGFYFAPYLKYNKYSFDTSVGFDYEATTEEFNDLTPEQQSVATFNGVGYDLEVTGDLNTSIGQLGAGVMIGYQWLIKDRVSIDFNFFGLGADYYLFSADFSSNEVPVDYKRWEKEIEEEFKDFSIVGDKLDVTAEDDRIKVEGGFILPNLRASISVGIAF